MYKTQELAFGYTALVVISLAPTEPCYTCLIPNEEYYPTMLGLKDENDTAESALFRHRQMLQEKYKTKPSAHTN